MQVNTVSPSLVVALTSAPRRARRGKGGGRRPWPGAMVEGVREGWASPARRARRGREGGRRPRPGGCASWSRVRGRVGLTS